MTDIRALNPVLTRAGMAAVFNKTDDGLMAKVTHLAFGTKRYKPQGTETKLHNEVLRIPVAGGNKLSDQMIELVALLDHNAGFEVAEMGAILEDGTLLAVWSDPATPLAHYTPGIPIAISYVLSLVALPPGSVQFSGNLDLTLFFGGEFATVAATLAAMIVRQMTLMDRIEALEARTEDLSGAHYAQLAAHTRAVTNQLKN